MTRRKPPEVGTVYAVPLRNGRWGACQIVALDMQRPCVAALDWIGDGAPALDALRACTALDTSAPAMLDGPPPPDYLPLGVLEPRDARPGGMSGWGLARHLAWARLGRRPRPPRADAPGPVRITIAGTTHELAPGTWRLAIGLPPSVPGLPQPPPDWSALDALTALTEIDYRGPDARVLDWIATQPRIDTLRWSGHGERTIDVSGTRLLELSLDGTRGMTLAVGPELETLRVDDLRELDVVAPDAELDVHTSGPGAFVPGLVAVRRLSIHGGTDASILTRYVALEALSLRGSVEHVERLAELPRLHTLQLRDAYGIDPSRVPSSWPALARVEIDGVRRSAVPALRAALRAVAHVEIRGAKDDAWIAANLENPFRDWVDHDRRRGERACAAWTKARGAAPKATSLDAARRVLETFVTSLARMELDTADREEVAEAYFALVAALGAPIDEREAERWLEGWLD
ncbi:hypothetical protein [Sandaracinus amylolyticus]|nr:hypothetical protein [Sandaracinus amylolyticus]